MFANDDQEVQLAYFFLDRFHQPPDITARQDELLLGDIMKLDRQIAYQKWCNRHGVEDGSQSFGDDVLDYRKAFGLKDDG